MTTDSPLQYQLHISAPIPFAKPETAPNGERQMFQYIATTLISGPRDAVLVDPPMTAEQAAQVINWVAASGKTLKHIFITHGHGDHWFGTGPLLEAPGGAGHGTCGGQVAVFASIRASGVWLNFGQGRSVVSAVPVDFDTTRCKTSCNAR